MKKKLLSLLVIVLSAISLTTNARELEIAIDEQGPKDERLYQTMRYCKGKMNYACTNQKTGEYCRKFACIYRY